MLVKVSGKDIFGSDRRTACEGLKTGSVFDLHVFIRDQELCIFFSGKSKGCINDNDETEVVLVDAILGTNALDLDKREDFVVAQNQLYW